MQDTQIRTKNSTQRTVLKSSNLSENIKSRFNSQQSSRRSTISQQKQQMTSWNFLEARRESQLNSLFNIRKHKLDQITKANYMIYSRINTQESYYPSKILAVGENNHRPCHSRFHTLQGHIQQQAELEQQRKILGPICNFKALSTPVASCHQKKPFYKGKKKQENKTGSITKINIKKLIEFGNQKQDTGLPSIFQFY